MFKIMNESFRIESNQREYHSTWCDKIQGGKWAILFETCVGKMSATYWESDFEIKKYIHEMRPMKWFQVVASYVSIMTLLWNLFPSKNLLPMSEIVISSFDRVIISKVAFQKSTGLKTWNPKYSSRIMTMVVIPMYTMIVVNAIMMTSISCWHRVKQQ